MRHLARMTSLVAFLAIAGPAFAASQRDAADCDQISDPDRRISGCTRIVQNRAENARNRAATYRKRGAAYAEKDNPARAIADYNEAIRLDPGNAVAYNNRGLVNHVRGDFERALADYNEAIRLDPTFTSFYSNRGDVYFAKEDLGRAVGDYNDALKLEPHDARVEFRRSLAHLFLGHLDQTHSSLKRLSELFPGDANVALWREIAAHRDNLPSQLAQASSHFDMNHWTAPILRLFLGQTTAAAVLDAAEHSDPEHKREQVCWANLLLGEWALLQGAREEAARLFRVAASDCRPRRLERDIARLELKALGHTVAHTGAVAAPHARPAAGASPTIVNPDVEEYLRGRPR